MTRDLTTGSITKGILLFSIPIILGNLLQQFYNIADTWVVAKFLGSNPLAAVGSSYTLMTFLTSILIGLCMGASACISMAFGNQDSKKMHQYTYIGFVFIGVVAIILTIFVYMFHAQILSFLRVPKEILSTMDTYLLVIFSGIPAVFLYNYGTNLLRAIGNSTAPLLCLGISAVLNIVLDLIFVIVCKWDVAGAAFATILSQYLSAFSIMFYIFHFQKNMLPSKEECIFDTHLFSTIWKLSIMTSLQQSIMNFGILMVQGLVNSFGTAVMAAFAASVKIDSFAYMPVQDFGNAFSTYVAQNYGAEKYDRIQEGCKKATITSTFFAAIISSIVFIFARQLLEIFIDASQSQILSIGVSYLRIEGSFYFAIGILFLLYGYYRAINIPWISVVLTIISLGTRVLLAYVLSSTTLGVTGIWMSVPIGWALADITGILYYISHPFHIKKCASKN